jgi:hypothetical protein
MCSMVPEDQSKGSRLGFQVEVKSSHSRLPYRSLDLGWSGRLANLYGQEDQKSGYPEYCEDDDC